MTSWGPNNKPEVEGNVEVVILQQYPNSKFWSLIIYGVDAAVSGFNEEFWPPVEHFVVFARQALKKIVAAAREASSIE